MATKRRGNPKDLDAPSKAILRELKAHFLQAGLTAQDLDRGYVGFPISQLNGKLCGAGGASQVDFDLAFKALEDGAFVKTGPMMVHENDPRSSVVIFGVYSKREYTYLTEAGYRVPTQAEECVSRRSNPTQIHISGGNFHQSQIALGEQVTQQQRIENLNDAEVVANLLRLLSENCVQVDDASKEDVKRLVATAQEGDSKKAKPIFQKLFGLATETVKQQAWGILTALITKAMGL